jgi:hypothetical protein
MPYYLTHSRDANGGYDERICHFRTELNRALIEAAVAETVPTAQMGAISIYIEMSATSPSTNWKEQTVFTIQKLPATARDADFVRFGPTWLDGIEWISF